MLWREVSSKEATNQHSLRDPVKDHGKTTLHQTSKSSHATFQATTTCVTTLNNRCRSNKVPDQLSQAHQALEIQALVVVIPTIAGAAIVAAAVAA